MPTTTVTVTMTRLAAAEMYAVLENLSAQQTARPFTYAMVRNKATLKPHYDALQACRKIDNARVEEYEQARTAVAMKYAVRKDTGEPIMTTNGMVRIRNDEEYRKEMGKLAATYPEELKALEAHVLKMDLFSAEPAEPITLVVCPLEHFPLEISAEMMERLMPMLEDDAQPAAAAQQPEPPAPNGRPVEHPSAARPPQISR